MGNKFQHNKTLNNLMLGPNTPVIVYAYNDDPLSALLSRSERSLVFCCEFGESILCEKEIEDAI